MPGMSISPSFLKKLEGISSGGIMSDMPQQSTKSASPPVSNPYADFPIQSTTATTASDFSDFPIQPKKEDPEWWRKGPMSDMPEEPPSFLNRQLSAIHEQGLDSPENLLLSSLGGGLEVGGKAIARSSIPYISKLLKIGEAGIGAGMVGTGAIQAYQDPEHAGSALVNSMLGGLALHSSMRGSKPPLPKEAIPTVKPAPRTPFGEWAEPTEQPRLPGTEHIDFTQGTPDVQLPLDFETTEPAGYQMHLPYGAKSWGNVPEPTHNASGQYNLFQNAEHSFEGVNRPSPFEFGRTPTMEDMAPRTTAPEPKSVTPSETVTHDGGIEGVVFQGDSAVFTGGANEVNMAQLKQRGYAPSGKLQNGWPVWHKVENLGDTAFTRAMRASMERGTGITSQPIPEGMQGTPVSPTEPIVLSEKLATTDKLLELEQEGYVVNRKLPDGSVELIPSHGGGGTTVRSDPFGLGALGDLVKKGGTLAKDKFGRIIENRLGEYNKLKDNLLWMGGHPVAENANRGNSDYEAWLNTENPQNEPFGIGQQGELPLKSMRNNSFAPTPPPEIRPESPDYGPIFSKGGAMSKEPSFPTRGETPGSTFGKTFENDQPITQHPVNRPYQVGDDPVLDREMGWAHFTSEPSNQVPARTGTTETPAARGVHGPGEQIFSDPFGIGVIGRALRGMRSVEQPAGGGRGGGGITEHPDLARDMSRINNATTPRGIQLILENFQNRALDAMHLGNTANETHNREMAAHATQRANEIDASIVHGTPLTRGGLRTESGSGTGGGGATIGQRLRAAVAPSNRLDMATERARIMAATTDAERQALITEYRSSADDAYRQGRHDVGNIYNDLATEAHDVLQFGQQQAASGSNALIDPDHQLVLDQVRASTDSNHLTDIIDEHTRLAANADSMGDDAMADQFREVVDAAERRRTQLNRFTPQLNRRPQPVLTNDEVIAHNTRIRNITTEAEGQALMDEFRQARQDAVDAGNRPRAQQFAELERTADDRRGDIWYQNYSRRGRYNYNSRPTPLRAIDEPVELQQIRSIDNESGAQNAADQYSGMHETAVTTGDTAAQAQMEMLYNESIKRYKELVKERESQGATVNPDAKTPQQIMDEYMHNPANRKTPKEIARYEAKKKRGMSGVASQLQGLEGFEGAAQTVDSGDFSTSIDHGYARQQLQFVPKGAPGIEFITEQAPQSLNDTGRYKVIYRNSEGNAIIKAEFSSQYGIGKISSWTYDQYLHRQGGQAGLNGRAMFKVAKAMAPYGVKMPSGSFSRFTANLMSNINRAGSHSNSGFINLGEIFGHNPDGNATLVDYVKRFFSKKNAKGQTVADVPKLAAKMQEAKQINTGEQPSTNTKGEKKPSVAREAYNFARGMTTTGDLSAALRQGLPMIFSTKYWAAMKPMFKSLGSEEAFNKTLKDLNSRPLFQRQWDSSTGKLTKSFAEIADMKLSDLDSHLTSREEAIASNWAETGGFLGSDLPFVNKETGLQRGYQKSIGRYSRATNRAYTAFLNQLRADSFEGLIKDAYRDSQSKGAGARDPYTDLTYAKDIAAAVNTLTGRGPLKVATPGVEGGRFGEGGHIVWKERSAERIAPILSDVLFSPRLVASRIRMLNPGTYMMASPFVRKQYLKGLLSVVGFNVALGTLAKGAGADVSLDPNSADFGKIKIGNTRLDFGGGFQQYFVAVSRLMSGHTTSSATGKDFELGQGYRPPTRRTIAQNFAVNKLHPVMKFAYDMADASSHQPFQVGDRTMQLFVPLIVGDVLELAKEDPKLLPLIAPITFGAGSQTYDKGAPTSKYIPKEYEPWTFTGGEAIK